MVVAGEASGDTLAGELVLALQHEFLSREENCSADVQPLRTGLAPRFFGAGGPRMAAAGVELAFDLTKHSIIGLIEVVQEVLKFRRLMRQLVALALERQPDVIICVDFHGFNGRFAAAVRRAVRSQRGSFNNWQPKIVQFVSPQVWASRAGRCYSVAQNVDLLLSIFPFEKAWYAERVPKLRVKFVGNPIVERFARGEPFSQLSATRSPSDGMRDGVKGQLTTERKARVILLPGSRAGEIRRHLPLIADTARRVAQSRPVEFVAIAPNEAVAVELRTGLQDVGAPCRVQVGNISEALQTVDLAISKSGTVLMECAMFGVPVVAFYKTSWVTYQIARRIVTVKWISMPNILANEELFPEFVQDAATPENLSRAALELLSNAASRAVIREKLEGVVASLGRPGAAKRAAKLVAQLIG